VIARRHRRPLRRWRGAVAVAFAGVLLAATAGGSSAGAQTAAPPGFVGMSAQDVFAGGAKYRVAQLEAMHAAGITLIRQVFDWSAIEPSNGFYNFSSYDPVVLAAAKLGIQIMPILFNEPRYLSARPRRSPKSGFYPPKSPAAIAAFGQAAVRWYGPGGGFWLHHPSVTPVPITIWQIWNEPNLNVYWEPKPNAAQYVAMLQSASQAIHALDPSAEIVSAGIPQSSLGVPLLTYLQSMLAAGAANWMDTLGVNAYSRTPAGMIAKLQAIRSTLDSGGGTKVALRVTEFGWSDNGPGSEYRLSPSGQANAISTVLHDFYNDRTQLNLLGFAYFDWRDSKRYPGVPNFWGLHTGLLNLNGTPKPALSAFSSAANSL
jgi:hypothetical protein